jgi:hypothetical protein
MVGMTLSCAGGADYPSPHRKRTTGERKKMKSNKLKIAVGVFLAFVMAIPIVG